MWAVSSKGSGLDDSGNAFLTASTMVGISSVVKGRVFWRLLCWLFGSVAFLLRVDLVTAALESPFSCCVLLVLVLLERVVATSDPGPRVLVEREPRIEAESICLERDVVPPLAVEFLFLDLDFILFKGEHSLAAAQLASCDNCACVNILIKALFLISAVLLLTGGDSAFCSHH